MSKTKSKLKPSLVASADPVDDNPWLARLTQLAFILTLALVIARAFMSEMIRDPFDFASAAGDVTPRGAGPTVGLVLDVLCCVPAILVLLRRVLDPQYVLRWTWSQMLFGAFALWCALSVAWSSDRFLAAVTASHMIAAAAILWATAQLLRSPLRLRLVAGVCFGILLAYLAQGFMYRYVDVPDNVRYWEAHKAEILQQRGWDADSFSARQFEKKITGGEMVGFNQSPNSFAAVIVMLLTISAGAAIQRRAHGDSVGWIVPVVVAAPLAFVIIYFTGSRTAFGTILIAAAILLALRPLGPWLAKHPTRAFAIAVGGFFIAWALLIAYGVHHGSLPQDSLNFRWRYWVAASRMFAHHPVLGVGWSNFGNEYLAYRLPAAAEEVRDPHNFVVRAFVELGIVGGILLLAWLLRLAWELTRPLAPLAVSQHKPYGTRSLAAVVTGALLGGAIINLLASVDFDQNGSYLLLEVFRRVLWTGLIAVGTLVVAVRSTKQQEIDDRPAPWLIAALLVALLVFFIHNLIDFSLAEPGPLLLFAMLVGAAEGMRARSRAGQRKHRTAAIAALSVAGVLLIAAIGGFVIPLATAEDQARASDEALRANKPERAAALLRGAHSTLPLNADYAYRAARAFMLANRPPEEVRAMLDIAIATDPSNVAYELTRGGYEMRLPANLRDAQAARYHFERAMKRDPMNVDARVDYADALQALGDRAAAAREYREALRRNDLLNPDEPKRLPAERVRKIEETARKLEGSKS